MPQPRLPGTPSVLLGAALLAACATPPPPTPSAPPKPLSAEQIFRESQGMAQLGQRHKEGEEMVRQGQQMVRDAQVQEAEGQRLIDAGRKIIQESEQGYDALRK
ncbi:hypothetical protein [Methylomagnum ishizawai]|uniref:hypothetical protein n=1 Tax=Methylomagnum ishizawai TaxID=1760988 RepID=UPI001C33CFFE|nr:hypothetical protein [Methylomagnum ishizawai]BBL76284.1 hypothetical protein MishRS11D_33820 [Methylomagnum ishizawai]